MVEDDTTDTSPGRAPPTEEMPAIELGVSRELIEADAARARQDTQEMLDRLAAFEHEPEGDGVVRSHPEQSSSVTAPIGFFPELQIALGVMGFTLREDHDLEYTNAVARSRSRYPGAPESMSVGECAGILAAEYRHLFVDGVDSYSARLPGPKMAPADGLHVEIRVSFDTDGRRELLHTEEVLDVCARRQNLYSTAPDMPRMLADVVHQLRGSGQSARPHSKVHPRVEDTQDLDPSDLPQYVCGVCGASSVNLPLTQLKALPRSAREMSRGLSVLLFVVATVVCCYVVGGHLSSSLDHDLLGSVGIVVGMLSVLLFGVAELLACVSKMQTGPFMCNSCFDQVGGE